MKICGDSCRIRDNQLRNGELTGLLQKTEVINSSVFAQEPIGISTPVPSTQPSRLEHFRRESTVQPTTRQLSKNHRILLDTFVHQHNMALSTIVKCQNQMSPVSISNPVLLALIVTDHATIDAWC